MGLSNLIRLTILLTLFTVLRLAAVAQVQINGTVYERTGRAGVAGVSVRSNSGTGTITDSLGRYTIRLATDDSLSFSYQGKPTPKFAVKEINHRRAFDISLHIDMHVLQTVEVQHKGYRQDSMEFRNEYRKIFEYEPQWLSGANGANGVGVNLDLLFSIKKMKRMEAFRRYLEREERDKYVSHRFNKGLVSRITGLTSPDLDSFMVYFRPTYYQILSFPSDYEYYKYIKDEAAKFLRIWRREQPASRIVP
ncbi:carboxypeptidase-like regulatory domain-containing protein [Chitinophaga horti]|uniref:Carboxypeptidase-like regulatory domain-containing protein n=1 Tax=Chitinophaga horti TaxID=2920382 RepID=A0ABY6JAS3_9BACT|nr:carboxypeptidase-like regulatory domain-containing protein [Chitinophaga horti]UYQ95414.1 carboxypeptidase-like regulatory domain-containing protein [Chitinophaga horti]